MENTFCNLLITIAVFFLRSENQSCYCLQLVDCFMEAYQHVYDRDEKRALAQAITNVMYSRPRFDYSADYFVRSYRIECNILRTKAALIKSVLDNHVCQNADSVILRLLK